MSRVRSPPQPPFLYLRQSNRLAFLFSPPRLTLKNRPTSCPESYQPHKKRVKLLTCSIEKTNAIGIQSKQGRYAATYAHQDIAFEFASWISTEFKLYIVMEYQRLKTEEQKQLGWSAKRELAKINYQIHTDAIKQNLIPPELDRKKASIIYASEADVLNVAMFGKRKYSGLCYYHRIDLPCQYGRDQF